MQDNLRELVQHPGWSDYLDLVEAQSISFFGQIIQLDPGKPESFVKFLELKAKVDALRDMTYLIELKLTEPGEQQSIVDSYFRRLTSMFKKLWR